MASGQFRKVGNGLVAQADYKMSGMVSDAGPYEAEIVGHVEGSRMGQLLVRIPDWGGATADIAEGDANAIPASYASPFYGTTYGTDTGEFPDTPYTSGQSYGMWMVPPDIGCKVLVTFAAGDISRCYWFACIYDSTSHHMVPGIARSAKGGGTEYRSPGDQVASHLTSSSVVPVVEYRPDKDQAFDIDESLRYAHPSQTMKLISQGLDRDPVRGAISSSSMRESPSNVYGISTPGRKLTSTDQVPGKPAAVFARTGGHQFVMDDGDVNGNDQLMRLRTSGGHQILMNDTEKILYIASNTGNQWMEFSADGSINVYGVAGINMRSKGPINMHSDSLINMNAMSVKITGSQGVSIDSLGTFSASAMVSASVKTTGSLTLSAVGKASLVAGAKLDVSSLGDLNVVGTLLRLNSGKPSPPFPAVVVPKFVDDVIYNGSYWVAAPKSLMSTCTVVPAHEPWERPKPKT